ncbi:uncharacterized protein FIBRA_04311 [Fibroporia radiculosa]|uniref:Uncharacterized protein n=1 Tax=Fibroporia radiculosa TaxID=599839 RepID=J4IA37_9APHY|nr:uncharacterized protein FIBRA_04311 [Fibroporia radiculosa]CCM02231.1 predicted protein [Fibroporia radiculosa]
MFRSLMWVQGPSGHDEESLLRTRNAPLTKHADQMARLQRFMIIVLTLLSSVTILPIIETSLQSLWAKTSTPSTFSQMPPLYGAYHDHELEVSRQNGDPQGAKYLYFANHARGFGWGYNMQELLLHAYVAYRTNRTFVWYNYTWNDDGSKWTLYNNQPIPSRIPLSAILDGPAVGASVFTDAGAAQPVGIVEEHFYNICPESTRKKILNEDMIATLGREPTADTIVNEWVKVLSGANDKCVEVPRDALPVFDIRTTFSPARLLDVWPGYSTSPLLREFRWSPLVELAFETNLALVAPSLASASTSNHTPQSLPTPADSSPMLSASRYTQIPGLLVLHARRGDFQKHCENLARLSLGFNGFNSLPELPDRFEITEADEAERVKRYRPRCFQNIAEIVARAERAHVEETYGRGRALRDLHVMTNGPTPWVEELKGALRETGHWSSVTSSRDLVVNVEQRYVKQAVDMLIGQRAQVFVGNGVRVIRLALSAACHTVD